MKLSDPITELKGVGDSLAAKLGILKIKTIGDLIANYPRRYEDYSNLTKIEQMRPGIVTLEAKISQARGRYVRRGMHITEAIATDSSGSVRLIWFNQPYRANAIKHGAKYFISGEYRLSRSRFSILNPSTELVSDFPVNTARIIPIYRVTKGLRSDQVRKLVREAILSIKNLPEHLPNWIIKEKKLVDYSSAVTEMHFPSSGVALERAKKRLGFEEVFELTLAALLNKYEFSAGKALKIPFKETLARDFVSKLSFKLTDAQRKVVWQIYNDIAGMHGSHADAKQGNNEQQTEVYGQYPEGAAELVTQHRAASSGGVATPWRGKQATAVRGVQPMNRLVEGDVGSGKTVVAAMAALMVMEHKMQVAFMAPTEILARQHADTLYKLLSEVGHGDKVGLLIGSLKPALKKNCHLRIATGQIQLIVGTHALISEKVDMHKLGLIIVDEQHRFGVEQRRALMKKISRQEHADAMQGKGEQRTEMCEMGTSKEQTQALTQQRAASASSATSSASRQAGAVRLSGAGHMPHVLTMTATPIPRSLALTLYGELDISVLDEMPPGRQRIITQIYSPNSRTEMYKKIDRELDAGRQAFVVCPLILDSDTSGGLSVEEVHKRMSENDFRHRKVGLLHGKMKSDEKDKVMQKFLAKEYDILVSTTVIEVGVDIPNASVMLIEGAERFGLAQIHQLRGRVGRGQHQSYCYLVPSDSRAPSTRLQALETMTDGFKLAELDLELRGPGAIYGTFQHGALDLRVAKLTDVKLIASARQTAQEFMDRKENLKKYPHLDSRVNSLRAITNLN